VLGSVYLAVMSLRERTRAGLALNELTPRHYRAPANQCGNSPSSQPRWGRQDSRRSSEDSRPTCRILDAGGPKKMAPPFLAQAESFALPVAEPDELGLSL
jgi:hypothetical protein